MLDRLGPPEDIVDAAQPPADQRAGKLEIAALIVLIVPLIGWLVGTVLVVASRAWSGRDKLIAALLGHPAGSVDETPHTRSEPAWAALQTLVQDARLVRCRAVELVQPRVHLVRTVWPLTGVHQGQGSQQGNGCEWPTARSTCGY